MLKIILSIFFLSITGIAAFIVFLNFILNKIFYLPHIKNQKTPDDYNMAYTNKFITTKHNKKIQIWDINPDVTGPVLLAVHGWANTSDTFLALAGKLSPNKRMILLNTRNHGDSEDEKYMTLLKYAEDISAVMDHLSAENQGSQNFVLIGHSLGGAAVLWAASKDERVKAVVTIGTFADLETMMRDSFIQNKMPQGFIGSLLTYIEFRIGEKMQNISPLKTVQTFQGPVLLVHGTKDEIVDFTDLNKIRKAAHRESADQFVMKGFGHSDLLTEEELATKIDQFLQKNSLLS